MFLKIVEMQTFFTRLDAPWLNRETLELYNFLILI